MTYDLAGNWQGWVSWYNGSLHTYGTAATNGSEASANCDAMVNTLTKAGVPASKIGIGSEFGGAVWSGVTVPNQTGCTSVSYDVPYNTIKGYGGTYTWDPQAQASYTVSSKGWSTYDDTADVGAKMRYVQSKGLGGLIIWSLDMDHKTGTVGQDPLLNAVKANWGTTGSGDNVPPTVAITSPSNGATVSGTISFSANASDNVGVSSVIFKADGNQIGSVSVSPYTISYNTTGLSNGSHALSATAYDAAGNSATATATVTVSNAVKDTTAPTVAITSPANNSTVSGAVSITATASDNVGVASVQFKIDGSNLGSALTVSPYTASWSTSSYSNGSHTISAVASDAAGNSKTATATVTVSNAVKDTTAPTVAITSPANNSTVSGAVSITATASDNVGVTSVQFKIDGTNLGSALTASPYTASWSTSSYSNGSHTISAVASDAAANTATSSVTVSVSNTVATKDTIPPTVSIASPANNSTVSGTVSITATASDNVGVTSVQFKIDGSNLGSALTASPYAASWSSTGYANGNHTISAVASDAAGNTATSPVTVTVSNTSTQASANDLWIYQNALSAGWSNGSWGFTSGPTFTNAQPVYTGCTASIQAIQPSGAALRFLSGGWSTLVPVNPSQYVGVSFEIYSTSSVNLSVYLMGGPSGVTFPTVKYGSIPNSQWTTVTIPFSSLDPSNQTFTMLVIQDVSGKSVTYYIDNVKLSGLAAPLLALPANAATNVASPVSISWNPVSGATSCRIQVATDQHFSSVVEDTTVSSSDAITLAGLQPGTTYYWWVCAHEGAATSQWSSTWSFATLAPPAPPQLVSPVNGSTSKPLTDTLSWSASQNATHYQIELSTSSSFSSMIIDDSTVTSTSRATGALSAGTTYYWRAQAINTAGQSGWSSVCSFTTLTPVASVPTLFSPQNSSTNDPLIDTLSWAASSNASHYEVEVSTSSSFSSTIINDSTVTSTSRTTGTLSAGTTYYWRVQSFNTTGQVVGHPYGALQLRLLLSLPVWRSTVMPLAAPG